MSISNTEKAYFKAAEAISELSDFPKIHLGAVVVDRHHIISSGYNSYSRCHPIQRQLDIEKFGIDCKGRLHAESSALLYFIKNKIVFKNAEIYIFRKHKDNTLAMARPCSSCMKLIKKCGIKKIHYTTEDGYAFEKLVY